MSQTTQFHDATSLPSSDYFTLLGDSSEVTSVSDFIEKVVMLNKEAGTEVFYRGHADENWELKPSIFRKPNGVEIEHQLFRDMVAHTPQSFSGCKSALDYLVQMQHYELPTRLLDVSTNPLVALYFACQPTKDDALAGALRGATVGEKLFREAQKVAHTILSILQGEVPTGTIVAKVTQTILRLFLLLMLSLLKRLL